MWFRSYNRYMVSILEAGLSTADAIKAVERHIERDWQPYIQLLSKSIARSSALLDVASKFPESKEEMLRAVVVLNHAYLEDLLRTVATIFLPIADASALDEIPLAGCSPKEQGKLSLGKVARHRGKTVDQVITESVAEYLERKTFSKVEDIHSLLVKLGIKLSPDKDWDLKEDVATGKEKARENRAKLAKMIERRHHIVHRADKSKTGEGLQQIEHSEVSDWLELTVKFTEALARACLEKKYNVPGMFQFHDATGEV